MVPQSAERIISQEHLKFSAAMGQMFEPVCWSVLSFTEPKCSFGQYATYVHLLVLYRELLILRNSYLSIIIFYCRNRCRLTQKNCCQYSVKYLKFWFDKSPSNLQLPMCLLCNEVLSNIKITPSCLQEHLQKFHPDKMIEVLHFWHQGQVSECIVCLKRISNVITKLQFNRLW